jgi:hypothetical protein
MNDTKFASKKSKFFVQRGLDIVKNSANYFCENRLIFLGTGV